MGELGDKRELFTKCLASLLVFMFGEGDRPRLAPEGKLHMTNSLHYLGLAIDIDLFDKNNKYLVDTKDHAKYGKYWKSLSPDCCWGGDFKNSDGNHYSVTFGGRK